MGDITEQTQALILDLLAKKADAGSIGSIDVKSSLINAGLLDSFGFIDLISEIEERTGLELDFAGLDPESFTSVNGLAELVTTTSNNGVASNECLHRGLPLDE